MIQCAKSALDEIIYMHMRKLAWKPINKIQRLHDKQQKQQSLHFGSTIAFPFFLCQK